MFGASASQSPSLFGSISSTPAQPAQASSSGSNLFGNVPTSQPSSLFSNTATSQPQQQQTSAKSLFGGVASSQAQQPTSSTSLFGNPATSQPQQQTSSTGSVFGGFGVSQPSQQQPTTTTSSGSLFGGLGTSLPSQQPQPATASGSLFGGLGTQQQQSQPQAPSGTGSLFGGNSLLNQPTNATQPQTTQQNGQQAQNGSSTTHGAYFNHLLERGKKRQSPANGASQLGELPSLQLGLGDISSKIRNLGGAGSVHQQGRAGDSRAHYLLAASGVSAGSTLRNLNAISAEAIAASSTTQSTAFDSDIESYLASQREKSTLDLIAETIEETKRDFDTFLEEHVQMNWDEQRQRIYEHFGLAKPSEKLDSSFQTTLNASAPRGAFGRSTRRGKTSIRQTDSPTSKSFNGSPMTKSVLGGSVSRGDSHASLFPDVSQKPSSGLPFAPEDPVVRTKQEKYASKVRALNSARLAETVFPLIEEFANVEIEAGTDNGQEFIEAYRAIKAITKETANVQRPSDPGAIRERQYAKNYLDEAPNSEKSLAMRKQIVDGSRGFLEKQFFNSIEELISKNPREANLGGMPSKVNKVRAYLRFRSARKDLGADTYELQTLDDDYCWALIFYMLRCGLVQEAAQYVADNERAIKSMDRNFPQYMAAFARDQDRRLPRDLQTRINAEYQQRSRLAPDNSIDPYRMACYKVVGRCDLSKKNVDGVSTGMQDWMWLIFNFAREVNRVEETAGDVFGLEEIRVLVEEIGQRHFHQNSTEGSGGHGTFFFLQILAGMFEQAIAWLYPHNYVVAVHFAIALDFYGLLRVADFNVSETDLLTYTTRQQPQISFSRMMGYYTRDFRTARAESASDYLTLICLNADLPGSAGKSQSSICHEALKELVLETREFAQLLGDIRSDGRRIKGAIEQRLPLLHLQDQDQDEFLSALTVQAAAVADDNGRTTDAVLLYHLAEDYDNVIAIINRALSDALTVEIGQEQMRLQPLKPRTDTTPAKTVTSADKPQHPEPATSLSLTSVDDPATLAKNMISLYDANALYFRKIRPAHRDACGVLLRMSEAKALVTSGSWAAALDVIASLDLLPLRAASNVAAIRAAAQAFNALPSVVARTIGALLTWTITCCGRQREVLRASAFEDRTRRAMADDLLATAKDLMVFAGLIRYKLPPRVYESLARAGNDVGAY